MLHCIEPSLNTGYKFPMPSCKSLFRRLDQMNCNFGIVVDDCKVSSSFPSSNSWSNWGFGLAESFDSANKRFVMDATTMINIRGEVFCDENKMDSSDSSSLSLYKDSWDDSFEQAMFSPDQLQLDHQLGHLAGIEEMDDIFFDTFLEDLQTKETLQVPFCFSTEPRCDKIPADYFLKDSKILETSGKHSLGRSKNLKRCALSAPAAQVSASFSPKHEDVGESSDKETSAEESALHELETVIAQFTDTTRICFRDAFFRLAKNSERQGSNECCLSSARHLEEQGCGGNEATKLETNVIDRSIAYLLFSNTNMYATSENHNSGHSLSQLPLYRHPPVPSDTEVPTHQPRSTVDHYRHNTCYTEDGIYG